jgi:hypothetical protein
MDVHCVSEVKLEHDLYLFCCIIQLNSHLNLSTCRPEHNMESDAFTDSTLILSLASLKKVVI